MNKHQNVRALIRTTQVSGVCKMELKNLRRTGFCVRLFPASHWDENIAEVFPAIGLSLSLAI